MGIFDKLFSSSQKKEIAPRNTTVESTIETTSQAKNKADIINGFSDEFEYNPLEHQVSFNIVQNPQKQNAFLIIMELYKKGLNVYDSNSLPENEIILENIESIANDITLEANNKDMLDLARFCKKISIDINDLVNENTLKDKFKLKEISKHFSALPSSNSKFRDKFKFQETIDGKSFNSKTQNPNHYDKFNHSVEQYDALKNGELLKYDLKGPVSFRKSLKRIFDNDKNFCDISKTQQHSWKNDVEQNPPIITENPIDSKENKEHIISQDYEVKEP